MRRRVPSGNSLRGKWLDGKLSLSVPWLRIGSYQAAPLTRAPKLRYATSISLNRSQRLDTRPFLKLLSPSSWLTLFGPVTPNGPNDVCDRPGERSFMRSAALYFTVLSQRILRSGLLV